MGKKSKKNKDLNVPEGMSRRQAKLAARAAERAALERDPRPYAGFAAEAQLVALQEFVPSARAKVAVKGVDAPVYLCTVLPGAVAAVARDGEILVGMQVGQRSHNPGRDLAYVLNWAKTAKDGDSLTASTNDGSQPALDELLDTSAALEVEVFDDFNWWVADGAQIDPMYARGLEAANDAIMPSREVKGDFTGTAWWIDAGAKAHIRWVRTDEENALLNALARVGASGELNLGENTKFAGVFRTHGICVPVFDLDPTQSPEEFTPLLEAVSKLVDAELSNNAQLTADERRFLENIKSRQVTIR